MTDDEQAEFNLLAIMTPDTHKFAIAIGYPIVSVQQALERMQLRDWVRLIDVTPVAAGDAGVPVRVFRVMPKAVTWYQAHAC